MARADLVRDQLERCGIEYLVWLPDSEARSFYDSIMASEKLRLVQVCREDEAMGVAAGLYMGGKNAAVLIQNAGLFNAIDALRGMIMDRRVPLLLMVGYKGYHGMIERKEPIDSNAVITEPILDALGIKHYLMDQDEDVENIGRAYREAMATNGPVALLIGKEYE